MGSLEFWSMVIILYQTFLATVVSWLTLGCRLEPSATELHEVTLTKVLYLYDPEACGRIYFYNLTTTIYLRRIYSSVVWPLRNHIASTFRAKIQLWLSLHIFWLTFSIINVSQGERSCSFYATLLPFTVTGASLLIADVINAILFLIDARNTYSESAIFRHLASQGHMRAMNKKQIAPPGSGPVDDTSWIAVLLAYISMRGIVQWIINFWIVKDNYYAGLEQFRRKQRLTTKQKLKQIKSSSLTEL
ncbi:hypothetical protein PYW08_003027 [Mythimna loreyi]|uniref:Uncharacterized protein n=1 Tax=Mythimna loreyi TaxID=667449 RepID=A0ACC2QU64_9NEOP|nr:hypothetical protein PYW08_003027 [Mythimna loreyi]